MDPQLSRHPDGDYVLPVLVWRFAAPRLAISSGPLGGGIGERDWLLNATVSIGYDRRDPDRHLVEIAGRHGLAGTGVGLLTAVDVTRRVVAEDAGAHATATVGISSPAWAAAPDGHLRRELPAGRPVPEQFAAYRVVDHAPRPGTINVVVGLPVRLGPAALVNAVLTATEAKTQALFDRGVAATGTASDAICVHCPTDGPIEEYAGPRSTWGARLARAVHAAVDTGVRGWLANPAAPPAVPRAEPS